MTINTKYGVGDKVKFLLDDFRATAHTAKINMVELTAGADETDVTYHVKVKHKGGFTSAIITDKDILSPPTSKLDSPVKAKTRLRYIYVLVRMVESDPNSSAKNVRTWVFRTLEEARTSMRQQFHEAPRGTEEGISGWSAFAYKEYDDPRRKTTWVIQRAPFCED